MIEHLKNCEKAAENDSKEQPTTPSAKKSICYMLYRYREELLQSQQVVKRSENLNKCKLHLTQELVAICVNNIKDYGMEELFNVHQEMMYTKKLRNQLEHTKQSKRLRTIKNQLSVKKSFE